MAYYGNYPEYIPTEQRRINAQKEMEKLRKKGVKITPVQPSGRKIATTFWGKAWCDHIEQFSDYENRLPRGRTYIRNGSVCHLRIRSGEVNAIVSGSSLYEVKIKFNLLEQKQWQAIKAACGGKIGSLLDLLNGNLSESVMATMCNTKKGLFPQFKDIKLQCSCFDWATMCKHVAAVLYGVGTRLDSDPSALFTLRGVNHKELIDVSTTLIENALQKKSQQQIHDQGQLSELFGIDLAEQPAASKKDKIKLATKKKPQTRKPPNYYSGYSIRKLRNTLGLTQQKMANKLKISGSTLSRYENLGRKKVVFSKAVSKKVLDRLWQK